MSDLCKTVGVNQSRTTLYHPQGNGVVERNNRMLSDSLRSLLIGKSQEEWDNNGIICDMRGICKNSHRAGGWRDRRMCGPLMFICLTTELQYFTDSALGGYSAVLYLYFMLNCFMLLFSGWIFFRYLCITLFYAFIITRRQMALAVHHALYSRAGSWTLELFFLLSHWSRTWACYLVSWELSVYGVPSDKRGGCGYFGIVLYQKDNSSLLIPYMCHDTRSTFAVDQISG